MNVERIIDADAHVTEHLEDLIPYISDEYDAVRELTDGLSNPRSTIFSACHATPRISPAQLGGSETGTTDRTGGMPAVRTSTDKREEMEQFDIDQGVLSPTLLLALNTVNNPRYAVALANAYNAWLSENFLADNDDLYGSIVVAADRPDLAAEEIDDRARNDSFTSVSLMPGALLPPAGDRKYDPIFDAAQRHDLPVLLHSASSPLTTGLPTVFRYTESYAEGHCLANPMFNIWNMVNMMYRGVPERFPDLDIVFQEAGLAYVPYVKWRMDDIYLELSDEIPLLNKLPSEYIDDQFYFTTQPLGHTAQNARHLSYVIEMVGPDNILYSSDLPHRSFDPPEELLNRVGSQFDEATIQDIMWRNSQHVFGL